jgi:hypothetical protein
VSISLVREFTQKVRPPRALWVPFPFGRPLGAPSEPEVQRRVLLAALRLLERVSAPVLEDFELSEDEEHLDARWQMVGRSCGPRGCSLETDGNQEPDAADGLPDRRDVTLHETHAEVANLADAHREYRRLNAGRTQVGTSGVTPESIGQAVELVHGFVQGDEVRVPEGENTAPKLFLRRAIDDLKAYYLEARLAEVGGSPAANELNDWLWLETAMGRLLVAARDRMIEITSSEEDPNSVMARGIVPRGYGKSGYGLGHTPKSQQSTT